MALAATNLALASHPFPTSAQTVARIYEPFATGAATTIYPGEDALGATDLVDLLQWYVPGLQVTRCPEGEIGVQIRGGRDGLLNPPLCSSHPLLIIDGVKISRDDFSSEILSLSPFRVERITVLRDVASTSVYGTRAA
ncbi:MAG: TonB-dependent receptor, partial [Longimicrobiales bacterium]